LQRTKAPERIDFIKDLVLEVLRLPRTLPGRLSPIFQPCGQGSFLEAVLLQMPPTAAGIHFLPTRTDDTMPLADRNDYIRPLVTHATLCGDFLVTFSMRASILPTTTVAGSRRTRINTGDSASRDAVNFTLQQSISAFARYGKRVRGDRLAMRARFLTAFPTSFPHPLRHLSSAYRAVENGLF